MVNDNGAPIDQQRDILQEIASHTKVRISALEKQVPLAQVKAQAQAMEKGDFPFEKALSQPGISFICEVKKASPSKGLIAPDFPHLHIALDYQAAAASAISCLTEPGYFQGQDSYLTDIAQAVSIPVLRKDFFVAPYMLYQAKVLGASAVLLICALLDDGQLAEYFAIADSLGLSAIFEVHDEEEVARALACGARIVGVNNRNLKTFALDLQTSVRLRRLVPPEVLFISESGIKTRTDMALLERCGVNAVLIGETLMRSEKKAQMLRHLKGLPKVKLCGLTRPQDIEAVNQLDVDYVGFVFAKSRRQVTAQQAKALREALRPDIAAVGVFVDASIADISSLVDQGVIQVIQLHGHEGNPFIQAVKDRHPTTPVWKAVHVGADFTTVDQADCFLLDNGPGGTGEVFDWSVLPGLDLQRPFFLAGGLTLENLPLALAHGPYGVDVSSGVETNGVKDPEKMQAFVEKVRNTP